jgi:hypothetical protein
VTPQDVAYLEDALRTLRSVKRDIKALLAIHASGIDAWADVHNRVCSARGKTDEAGWNLLAVEVATRPTLRIVEEVQ